MTGRATLGYLAEFINGYAFNERTWEEQGTPIVRIQNLTDSSKPFNYTRHDPGPKFHIEAGDILVSWSATLDVFEWTGPKAYVNQHIFKVVPNRAVVDKSYLIHALRKAIKSMAALTRGSTMKHINRGDFLGTEVRLPPINEQQRIAAILDRADSLCCKRQQALRLADRFLRSTFIDMFGDPIANEKGLPVRLLGDVCRFYAGNSLANGEPFDGQTGGFLHIKVGDMNLPGNEVDIHIAREWSSRGVGSIIAPEGSILIPKRGGAIATNKKRVLSRPCALDPNLMAIEPGEKLRQEVLFEWFKQFDLSSIASGSAVPQLNKGDLAPLKITVPPLELQDKFVKIAKKVKSMLARQGDQLALIQSASAALSFTLLDNES